MKITAAIKNKDKPDFEVKQLDIESPRDDEILVKIAGVGLCHTDIVFADNPDYAFPAVFGHEGSGVVEQVGKDVTKVAPGDHVLITFRSCGDCLLCEDGHAPYCASAIPLNYIGSRPDGTTSLKDENGSVASNFFGQSSFASHAITYERNVVKVDKALPLDILGPLGCGIQTGAGAVMRSLNAKAGSSILVTGGGPVGLSAVMGAKIQQCETIILLEPMQSRRDMALEIGATHVLDPNALDNLNSEIRKILPMGFNYAIDTTGIPALLNDIMACLGSMGTLGLVGITPLGNQLPGEIMAVVSQGQTVRGIIEGDSDPDEFLPELLEHYQNGTLPFDKLVKTYPLSDINQAIADQHAGKCIKAVLIPEA